MLGMKMPNVSGLAVRRGSYYVGHITPEMFGSYRAVLNTQDGAGVHVGAFTLKLGL